MDYIYKVFENVQKYDGDAWDHWIDEEIISYHSSKENAEKKIESLVKENGKTAHLTTGLNGEGSEESDKYGYKYIELND